MQPFVVSIELSGLDLYALFTYEIWVEKKIKIRKDFGVLGELRFSAFERHQNHQNPLGVDPFRGPFIIRQESFLVSK